MKAYYSQLPAELELMPDGYHIFRFDITPIVSEGVTSYECLEVIIYGALTRKKLVKAAIEDKWGINIENELINDYNSFLLGTGTAADKTAYVEFLAARKALKKRIKELIAL